MREEGAGTPIPPPPTPSMKGPTPTSAAVRRAILTKRDKMTTTAKEEVTEVEKEVHVMDVPAPNRTKVDEDGPVPSSSTSTSTSASSAVAGNPRAICLRNLQWAKSGRLGRHSTSSSSSSSSSSSTNAMLSRIYKDILDIPHFPTVQIKCIFETREEKRERRRIERARRHLQGAHHATTTDAHADESDASSSEDDSDDLDLDIKALKVIITPLGGPWKHNSVPFRFDIPKTYPNDPPKLTCLKRIYHPSIDINGRVCLGLINEWLPILNFEAIIIELEQLLAHPSSTRPLVKDVGHELFENPELFHENVERSKRGGVIRGVYYDRLQGVPPEGVGYNSLKNICFTKIFEWTKQAEKAKLLRQRQQRHADALKEGWEEGVLSEDDEASESDSERMTPERRARDHSKDKVSQDSYKRFDAWGVQILPWELREIIEDYSRIIHRNEMQKLERKQKKIQDQTIKLGGNVYIRNLAGKMTMLEGVEPDMTIWQMKELLDAKTGMVPYSVQLFYHQTLDDTRTVAEYNIRDGSVVYIVLAWGGG